jgi:hypothetical protein
LSFSKHGCNSVFYIYFTLETFSLYIYVCVCLYVYIHVYMYICIFVFVIAFWGTIPYITFWGTLIETLVGRTENNSIWRIADRSFRPQHREYVFGLYWKIMLKGPLRCLRDFKYLAKESKLNSQGNHDAFMNFLFWRKPVIRPCLSYCASDLKWKKMPIRRHKHMCLKIPNRCYKEVQ